MHLERSHLPFVAATSNPNTYRAWPLAPHISWSQCKDTPSINCSCSSKVLHSSQLGHTLGVVTPGLQGKPPHQPTLCLEH